MHREKITGAINTAMNHLKDFMRTLEKNNNDEAVANSLWLASSEIEYALMLSSLMHPNESESFPWKHGSQPKQVVEVRLTIVLVKELLEAAKNNFEAGATEKAYEEAWMARNLLLKVQELFEKKRKGMTTQPTRTR